jgi:hypothetical protein
MGSAWRERLVGLFDPEDGISIACDPSQLMLDDVILTTLSQLGFRVVPYDDPISFRLIYEEDFRCRWDHQEDTPRLLVWTDHSNADAIPWDIIEGAVVRYVDPADFFPEWPASLFTVLEPRDWDLLESVAGPGPRASLSEAMQLLLRGVFHIDVSSVRTLEDLHWVLSRIHWASRPVPAELLKMLAQQLSLPYDPQWLIQRGAWLAALFDELEQPEAPVRLPFLSQIRRGRPLALDDIRRARESVELALSRNQAWQTRDWLHLALDLGHLEHARILGAASDLDEILATVERQFGAWILSHYGLLGSLPYWPKPVMLHQVLPWIYHKRWPRVALIVLDGLSAAEWSLVKDAIGRDPKDEGAVFAWVPTLTSVSRQSLLSGRRPREFASKIFSTQAEPGLWQRFWLDQGESPNTVWYSKHVDDKPVHELLSELGNATRVALIVNRIDDLAHSATMGMTQVLHDVQLWLQTGWFRDMINGLNDRRFTVIVTSDHGHLEVVGSGMVHDPGLAVTRGQRARIYGRTSLLERVAAQGIVWPYLEGLPSDFYVLLAENRSCFVTPGERLVSHGGAHWLEMLVPWGIWEA